MRKIALDVDSLRVESFGTQAAPAGRGTVHGHGALLGTSLDTCGDILTCAGGCDTRPLGTGGTA